MSSALRGRRIGFLERPHEPGAQGRLVDEVVPLLLSAGADVDIVQAELSAQRLDRRPRWDLVVLKSGSPAALHTAAAAEARTIPVLNSCKATRLAQDKLAAAAVLQAHGLPIAPGYLAWLGEGALSTEVTRELECLESGEWLVKAARSSQGAGLWPVGRRELVEVARRLPPGPYLIMEQVPHTGDDLKVFVAGRWLSAIERPFPARTLAAKRGRPVAPPARAEATARAAGQLLGLTCFGCDFVHGPTGWVLVDVNAFPGYKGAAGAAEAVVEEIERVLIEGVG